jgi:pSer/pThr/pTyr-binding forkhead associated (FHA) protein
MAYLRYTMPGQSPKVIQLIKDVTVIGRSAQIDVPLADDNASRQHCQIRKWAGKFVVEDLQSKNGTFVNGAKIAREHPLNDGDLIAIGDTTIVFKNEKT